MSIKTKYTYRYTICYGPNTKIGAVPMAFLCPYYHKNRIQSKEAKEIHKAAIEQAKKNKLTLFLADNESFELNNQGNFLDSGQFIIVNNLIVCESQFSVLDVIKNVNKLCIDDSEKRQAILAQSV